MKDEKTEGAKKRRRSKSNSQLSVAVRQFRRNKLAMIGLCVFIVVLLLCIFAEQLTPYDYAAIEPRNRFAPLSGEHPMGTDNLGRDLLTRLLKGGQISFLVAICSVVIGAAVGAALGCTAAYLGGWYEVIIMRIVDILMSIPALLMATAIATALGTGIFNSIIAISIASIASLTRMIYSTALTVKGQEYIRAARSYGASHLRCVFKYVLPNCAAPLIILACMRFGTAITQIASLSFLGLGVLPPTPEWGSILNAGKSFIREYPPIVIAPGIFIAIVMICVNFIGDGLRDALDPKQKR